MSKPIVVGCFMAAAAAVRVWARTTALDTDAYLDTVSSLPDDPAISTALAENVVDLFRVLFTVAVTLTCETDAVITDWKTR